jgi:transcriptional regulator with XRE-family HTH domain
MQENMGKWQRLLLWAKPDDWKWEPPKTLSAVKAKKPPEGVRERLDEVVLTLPDTEKEILQLRLVDGFSQEEIAEILGCKPLLVALIEQKAIERLAENLKAKEETVRSWVAWWGKERQREIEAALPKPSTPSPKCLPLARIYEAVLRWDWSKEERRHIRRCARCRSVFNKVSKQVWHPSFRQLWNYVTEGELSRDERLDIRYHIEESKCRRCSVVERILRPVTLLTQPQPRRLYRITSEAEPLLSRSLSLAFMMPQERAFSSFHPTPSRPIPSVIAAITPTPVTLAAGGFAGEETEEIEVTEGDFKAELRREPKGWVARAQAKDVPKGSRVQFVWVTPEGDEKIKVGAELKRAFGDYYYAEKVLAPTEKQLGEGYFAAILLPPTD